MITVINISIRKLIAFSCFSCILSTLYGQQHSEIEIQTANSLQLELEELKNIKIKGSELKRLDIDKKTYSEFRQQLKEHKRELNNEEMSQDQMLLDIQKNVTVYSAWQQSIRNHSEFLNARKEFDNSDILQTTEIEELDRSYKLWLKEPSELHLSMYDQNLNNLSVKSKVRTRITVNTVPKSGATIKYQLRADRILANDKNVYTMGSSSAEIEMNFGRYFIWSERNNKPTSSMSSLYLIVNSILINIEEIK